MDDGTGTGAVSSSARCGATKPAARRPLSRDLIVSAAIDFVTNNGLRALTMRRLGKSLDVEAMALYRYVGGREDLLEAIINRVVNGLEETPGIELHSDEGWQSYLQRLAHGVRAMAHLTPEVFPLIATRHPAAPWLRPPLRSLRIVDAFLRALKRCGFDDEGAVAAYRAFSSFLLGHLLLEVSARGADTAPDEPLDEGDPDDSGSALVLVEYPELQRLEPLLSEDHADAEFEQSLENLLDRLERFLVLE